MRGEQYKTLSESSTDLIQHFSVSKMEMPGMLQTLFQWFVFLVEMTESETHGNDILNSVSLPDSESACHWFMHVLSLVIVVLLL